MKHALGFTVAVATICLAAQAAAVTVFQDRAAWAQAVADLGLATATQDFDGFADTTEGALPDFTAGPVGFVNPDVGFTGESGVRSGALFNNSDEMFFRTSDTTGPVIRAIGFDHAVNVADTNVPFVDLSTSTLNDFSIVSEEPGSTFKGVVIDDPAPGDFVSLQVSPSGGRYETFDNLSVAYAAPEDMAAVPLPAPALMLLLGLAGLAAVGGRRAFSR